MLRSGKSCSDYFKKNRGAVALVGALALLLFMLALILPSGAEGESLDEEERLCSVVSRVSGVGECEVMINYTDDGEVYGVIILCDGAENVYVRERILDLLTSLYGIRANRISILKIQK